MTNPKQSIARMPRKHRAVMDEVDEVDVQKLIRAQSFRDAVVAGLIVVILFSVLWAMLSTLLGRIFPWMTVLLGFVMGRVIRRAGRGLDWRFAALAAGLTLVGSLVGNVVVAAAFTAEELGVTTIEVLRAVTAMTWPVFFAEVVSAADIVFALFAAAVAAYFANRRLTRSEYTAYRRWCEEHDSVTDD
jgi:hypothetical protein